MSDIYLIINAKPFRFRAIGIFGTPRFMVYAKSEQDLADAFFPGQHIKCEYISGDENFNVRRVVPLENIMGVVCNELVKSVNGHRIAQGSTDLMDPIVIPVMGG